MGVSTVRASLLLTLLTALGCTSRMPPPGHDDVLVGHVRAPQSLVLPPGAVLRLMLLDIDAPDVPDYIVAFEERPATEFPATLEVNYDPHGLVPHLTYGLAAELRLGERVLADCEPLPVATKGNPTSVELQLVPSND